MKTILITLLLAALLLVAGALVFIRSGLYDISALTPHGTVTTWIMETTTQSSVERRAGEIDVPDLGDDSLVLAGVDDFEQMCAQCHGRPGRERTAVGQGLNPSPPDLAESANELTPEELFWVTKNGIKMTGMPAWGGTHKDEALWPVVALMASLPQLDAAAYEGLLRRAEGMGHHAREAGGNDQPSGAADDSPAREDGQATSSEDSEETEHDHSTHEH